MTKPPTRSGAVAQNPLAVISLLIGVVEAAFSYPVTKLSGDNQTIIVKFMVGFPILLLMCFFITVWFKPGHLYGPKDYANPKDFLLGIGKVSAIPPQAIAEPSRRQPIRSTTDLPNVAIQPNP